MELGASATSFMAVFGAAIGSFLNVVAYRLPRRLSLVGPRSVCPSCGKRIAAWDNVPLVSWLLLRGRCRSCGATISVRYPVIELVTAALFALVAVTASSAAELVSGLVLVATLVVVAAIDLEYRIVPNRVLGPAAIAAFLIWGLLDPGRLLENAIAGLAAGTALLIPAIFFPQGMGMGDVKLAAVLGLFLGRSVAPALLLSFAFGSIVGVGILVVRGTSARKHAIPFAPFMALGGIIGQLFGDEIIDWYLDHR
jgi:leader peptidase (prepilin peptidase)/N-methyltransferase